MGLETTTNRVTYSGNGSTTVFSFPYYFLADSSLVVIERLELTGTETPKTLTTHYTVSGEGEAAGGTVTMLVAPVAGVTLIIYRDEALTQDLDMTDNGVVPAESLETRLDKLTMIVQRLDERLDRSVSLSDGFTPAFDTTLPSNVDDAANKVPLINNASDGFADVADWPSAEDIAQAQTYAANADTSAGASATSATASSASATASAASATASAASAAASAASAAASAVSETAAAASAASVELFDQPYELTNISISAAVAANALTIALKTKSGINPSAGDPIRIGMRSSTITSGVYNQRLVTGATSLVISSGSTLGHSSGNAHYVWVYAIDNAGTIELAASTALFNEYVLQSSTAEGGAGGADLARTLYSTTARTNVPVRLIGRIKTTQATAGTWATAPSEVVVGDWAMASTIPAYMRYELAASQTIGSSGATLAWDTRIEDSHNSFGGAGFEGFRAQNSGLYLINVSVQFGSASWTAGNFMTLALTGAPDPATKILTLPYTGTYIPSAIALTSIQRISAGTLVRVTADNGHSANRDIGGGNDYNYFEVIQIGQ